MPGWTVKEYFTLPPRHLAGSSPDLLAQDIETHGSGSYDSSRTSGDQSDATAQRPHERRSLSGTAVGDDDDKQ